MASTEEIYANVESPKDVDSRGPRRMYVAVILSLGVLSVFLLVGLIGLGVLYHFSVCGSRTLTEIELLQDFHNNLTDKTCPAGWREFSSACYLLSTESGSWEKGKDDCRERGAHLVVIDSNDEQTFLSGVIEEGAWYWIGLSDADEEGTWKWIDGTPVNVTNWREQQPDNGGGISRYGEEDCAEMVPPDSGWNDVACENSLYWICEKPA